MRLFKELLYILYAAFIVTIGGFALLTVSDFLTEVAHSSNKVIKVAIVDSGIDYTNKIVAAHICPTGSKDFTTEGLQDQLGHGKSISRLIANYAGEANYCFINIKIFDKAEDKVYTTAKAIEYISELNPDVVNLSLNGGGYDTPEEEAFKKLHKKGIKVFVAAGNNSKNLGLEPSYPASYANKFNNITVVGALGFSVEGASDVRLSSSNYGDIISEWELGIDLASKSQGTSIATAIATGKYIKNQGLTKK